MPTDIEAEAFSLDVVLSILISPDSIRDMNKYSALHKRGVSGNAREMSTALTDVKLFRSQRNYYMTGVTLFIWL